MVIPKNDASLLMCYSFSACDIMVFGLFEDKGKIEMDLPTLDYEEGETIKGIIKLELKKPKKAKTLRVQLVASRTVERMERRADGKGLEKITDTQILHSFALELDKEKEYASKEYEFSIRIPRVQVPPPPRGIARMATLGSLVTGAMNEPVAGPVKWHLKASLDIPMSTDITKEVQLNIV